MRPVPFWASPCRYVTVTRPRQVRKTVGWPIRRIKMKAVRLTVSVVPIGQMTAPQAALSPTVTRAVRTLGWSWCVCKRQGATAWATTTAEDGSVAVRRSGCFDRCKNITSIPENWCLENMVCFQVSGCWMLCPPTARRQFMVMRGLFPSIRAVVDDPIPWGEPLRYSHQPPITPTRISTIAMDLYHWRPSQQKTPRWGTAAQCQWESEKSAYTNKENADTLSPIDDERAASHL